MKFPRIVIVGICVVTAPLLARAQVPAPDDAAAAPKSLVGQQAPPLALHLLEGGAAEQDLSWTALKGHVVVLDFWATWCGPCVASLPHLNTLTDDYRDRGVKFIAITDEDRQIVERFVRVRPIKAMVGLDPKGATFRAFCGTSAVPQSFVIDQRGVVAAGPLHPAMLTPAMLDAALAGQPVPAPPVESAGLPVPPILPPPADAGDVNPSPATSKVKALDAGPPEMFDSAALFQVVVAPADNRPASMAWSTGCYAHTAVDLETLLTRLYGLRSPLLIDWETEKPQQRLRVVAKMPEQREDLLPKLVVPALEASLDLSIGQERRKTTVYVMTAPDGPGRDLARADRDQLDAHRFHQVAAPDMLFATYGDFDRLVSDLERLIGHTIVNETGFSGYWSWGLHFAPGDTASVIRNAREQLGLALTPEQREVDMVVVRSATATKRDTGE
ncbi:MAG TPA: redoxin domain-containing protein [Phycisphaerae bacterium]|nr:redoxin domain-containing protein [Phycisphaerales bacterium]HRX83693.1 redoxin domain-containing protein [Phycisphaerae bacterium]